MSGLESVVNIGSGFILSLIVWSIVAPLYGFDGSLTRNASICAIFTLVSLVRSYFWRRLFNQSAGQTRNPSQVRAVK